MRAFVPARIKDNPSVNRQEYEKNLMHLGPVARERLMNGDWTIMPTGLIKPEWIRFYRLQDRLVHLLISRPDANGEVLHTNEILHTYHEAEARRFITVDTAGGMKDITAAAKGKSFSWTVAAVWDYKVLGMLPQSQASELGVSVYSKGQQPALLLREVWRARAGFMDVASNLVRLSREWSLNHLGGVKTLVENATMGPHLLDLLQGEIEIQVISTGSVDKVARNTAFQNMMEKGQVYFPQGNNSWLQTYLAEILSWQGIQTETNDQIDVSSYAAMECGGMQSGGIILDYDPREQFRKKMDW